MHKLLPLFFLGAGIFILVQVIMPLLSFKIWEITVYSQNRSLVSASPDETVSGVSVEDVDNFPAFVSTTKRSTQAPYKDFDLTIAKLGLNNIKVVVDTNDFNHNLGQLPGSALPGEVGNVFVSGHSELPQFFSTDNFQAIFSNLPKIQKGDDIILTANGQKFTYEVEGLTIVDPNDTWVINPPDNTGRYLSLMTCVPPGLNIKRLIVLAKLKQS